ncbi:MAG: 2OG-Fe(II) oxygenase [Alphaproteobacteria bacterium]|nr:2OG-Fe(II) oxygenase [Alphaproteobacteria bacterium]
MSRSFDSIPVIDLGPLWDMGSSGVHEVARQITQASTEIGFFYVRGHHVSRELMRAVYFAAKYFFALPDETKRAISVNSAHRGYVPFAQTTQPGRKHADLKESFNFAYPFAADDPEMSARRPLIGLNQWPRNELEWRALLEEYYAAVFELGQGILRAFAISLDMPVDFFRGLYRKPLVRARLIHYPPQAADDGPQSAAEHTDYGTITILWQDHVGGLQVRNRAGAWVDAPPIEDSFVINIGDMLQRWSNDRFVSTPHRVVNASGRERYSIPVFYDPDYDAVVECLPHCASSENPAKYEPIVAGDYINGRYDSTYTYRRGGINTVGVHG